MKAKERAFLLSILAAGSADPELYYAPRPQKMEKRRRGPDDFERMSKAEQKRARRRQRNLKNISLQE